MAAAAVTWCLPARPPTRPPDDLPARVHECVNVYVHCIALPCLALPCLALPCLAWHGMAWHAFYVHCSGRVGRIGYATGSSMAVAPNPVQYRSRQETPREAA